MTIAALKGIVVSLLDAVTTGTGEGVAVPHSSHNLNISVRGEGTITAGTVVLEEASTSGYTGTWSLLATIVLATDVEQIYHLSGTVRAIRARMTADVTGGGTCSVDLVSD